MSDGARDVRATSGRTIGTVVASTIAGTIAGSTAWVVGAAKPMPVVVGLTAAGAIAAWRTASRLDEVGRRATFAVALVMAAMAWFAPHGALEETIGLPDGVVFAALAALFAWLGWTHERAGDTPALPPPDDA